MRHCLKIMVGSLLFVSARAICADTSSQSVNINLAVNIAPPVCKLKDATQTIDFDEVQVFDITMGYVKKNATFSFTECTNVNSVTISFSGNNVNQDRNFIRNKQGADNATGVAIKLYDEKQREIRLKDPLNTELNKQSSFNFSVTAALVKENGLSAPVTPGKIDTSVNLNITYH